jgi:tetratricopeptide (TPR) repeat protein
MSFLAPLGGRNRYMADQHYTKALEAYQKRRLDDALTEVAESIRLFPQESEYHAAQGIFQLEVPDEAAARASFERALQQHEGEAAANYGMGVIAFNSRDYTGALEHFSRARIVDPNRPETLYYMALSYHRQQDNVNAKALMDIAADLMDAKNDRRKLNARKWQREFEKLIRQAEKTLPPDKPTAPLPPMNQRPLLAEPEDK